MKNKIIWIVTSKEIGAQMRPNNFELHVCKEDGRSRKLGVGLLDEIKNEGLKFRWSLVHG
jgi:hypothetical protein